MLGSVLWGQPCRGGGLALHQLSCGSNGRGHLAFTLSQCILVELNCIEKSGALFSGGSRLIQNWYTNEWTQWTVGVAQ